MATTSSNYRPKKKKPVVRKREYAYQAGFVTLRILWSLTKLAMIASLAILAMAVIVFGMLCSSLTSDGRPSA